MAGVGVSAVNLWWLLKIDIDRGAVVGWRGLCSTTSTTSMAGLAALTACVSKLSNTRWISGIIMGMIRASTRLAVPCRTVKLTLMELVELLGTPQTVKLTLLVDISLLADLLVTTVVVFHIVPHVLFSFVAEAAAGENEEDEAGAK